MTIDGGSDDLIPVVAALHDQMHTWQGTPYEWGGTEQSGVDCSRQKINEKQIKPLNLLSWIEEVF